MTLKAAVSLLLVTLCIIHTGSALQCYLCMGFNSLLPYDQVYNNPACTSEDFDASQLLTENSTNVNEPSCMAIIQTYEGMSITSRTPDDSGPTQTRTGFQGKIARFHGYFCDGNLCNSQDP
ncbi:uncharacterized protein LOC121869966 [Homarus americanus]|uniref:uncharacterized protein LOC121869966 n=1 Tax=Homarus americanus TaxID=6706 RepID=UPI001C489773|nr:uncharacterized protein LOC121869966 [Homarus americanus]XP_042227521.1 uncharacterized protein LOC121869966 [Homarus americanus]